MSVDIGGILGDDWLLRVQLVGPCPGQQMSVTVKVVDGQAAVAANIALNTLVQFLKQTAEKHTWEG